MHAWVHQRSIVIVFTLTVDWQMTCSFCCLFKEHPPADNACYCIYLNTICTGNGTALLCMHKTNSNLWPLMLSSMSWQVHYHHVNQRNQSLTDLFQTFSSLLFTFTYPSKCFWINRTGEEKGGIRLRKGFFGWIQFQQHVVHSLSWSPLPLRGSREPGMKLPHPQGNLYELKLYQQIIEDVSSSIHIN